MSLKFLKNFFGIKGEQVAKDFTALVATSDLETATKAEFMTMEQDLDRAGSLLVELRSDLKREQDEATAAQNKYDNLLRAAEIIEAQIAGAEGAKKTELEASLDKLVVELETQKPVLDAELADVVEAQTLLDEAEAAYREKANDLKAAKGELTRAARDIENAKIREDRAKRQAEKAAQVAGLRDGGGSTLNVALTAMREKAAASNQRAEASRLKTEHLGQKDPADANIAAALAAASSGATTSSASDRLQALRRK